MDKEIVCTIAVILVIASSAMVPLASAQLPVPHGISGLVYISNGITEASWGTHFSVNDTVSGDFIEGTTGGGPHDGWYSVSINGTDGDEITVKAWNATHYGIRTVTLVGDMDGIDVIINTPLPDITPPATAQPQMHGISGLVYMSDGVTEASWSTNFCVNNTNPTVTTGGYIEGTTGAGPYSSWYSVAINGTDGDEITVKAWNATHYGIRTVTLVGDMRGIDVIINTPLPDITPPASVSNLNGIDKGTTWILWNWTNPSDADFNHTKVWIDGEFKVNVATPDHSYNATGFKPGTAYAIGTRTVDSSSNINQTWVNDTATTKIPNQPPVADPNGHYIGHEGVAITLNGSGSYDPDGSIVSYNWVFGDGNTGTGVNPAHTYAENGIYTVSLAVTDTDGATNTNTTTAMTADTKPAADFFGSPTSGFKPLTVNFSDNSTTYDGLVAWVWDFGDGCNSNDQNPTHLYLNEGLYNVTLTVSEADGDSNTEIKTDYINVTKFIDPWTEINEELDSLIEKINATCITHKSTKRILIYKLKLAQAMKDYAHGKYNTGNIGFGKNELEEVKRQVESFEDLVKRTSKISYADKLIFLADSAEIKAKITTLIEYIETEHSC